MKKLLTPLLLTFLSVNLFAQDPGTLNKNFADNGLYTFNVTGNDVAATFLIYRQDENAGDGSWSLLSNYLANTLLHQIIPGFLM